MMIACIAKSKTMAPYFEPQIVGILRILSSNWQAKSEGTGLHFSENCMILTSAVLSQYTGVTTDWLMVRYRFSSEAELEAFKCAVVERYPAASWTSYLQLYSTWISIAGQPAIISLHHWRGITSIWLSGDGAQLWYNSEDFTQLRRQASDAVSIAPLIPCQS